MFREQQGGQSSQKAGARRRPKGSHQIARQVTEPTGHGEDWMKLQEDTEQRSDII